MLTVAELRKIARARLDDSLALLAAGRHQGAAYLCGYAVELALKARICRTLRWQGYPATKKDFEGFQSFKTHDLDVLLRLSGRESQVKLRHFAEWSEVVQWSPESRYQPVGSITQSEAQSLVAAARAVVKSL